MQIQIPDAFSGLFEDGYRYKGYHGGRGSGKSHSAAAALVIQGAQQPLRITCVREVQKSIKDSVKTLLDDKIKVLGLEGTYSSLEHEIRHKNGTRFNFTGLSNLTADQIKSLEGTDRFWIEEAQTISARSLEILKPTIRKPGSEIWATWNPRNATDPIDMLLRGEEKPNRALVREVNYDANPFFTDELEEERQFDYRANRHRYSHIWLGAYEPMVKGAIWDRELLRSTRVPEPPELKTIVIAVDPAVSNTDVSNRHGIIVAGLGTDGHGYVLEDASLSGTPRQWAQRTVAMFDKWQADRVVVERNQGGDMVKHTLKTERYSLPIIEVTATRGKHVRAEPISALYAIGQIHHVGTFDDLETEMCKITAAGYEGEEGTSPDRADAMVWAMTNLFPTIIRPEKKKPRARPRAQPGGWMG